LLKESRLIKAH